MEMDIRGSVAAARFLYLHAHGEVVFDAGGDACHEL